MEEAVNECIRRFIRRPSRPLQLFSRPVRLLRFYSCTFVASSSLPITSLMGVCLPGCPFPSQVSRSVPTFLFLLSLSAAPPTRKHKTVQSWVACLAVRPFVRPAGLCQTSDHQCNASDRPTDRPRHSATMGRPTGRLYDVITNTSGQCLSFGSTHVYGKVF